MQKFLVIFSLIGFATLSDVSFSKDFRVLDLSDPCDELLLKEEKIGGIHNSDYNFENEHAFSATFMGRVSSLIYKCNDKNLFKEGMQFTKFTGMNDAIAFFNDTKIYLLQQYGEPTLDMSSVAAQEIVEDIGVEPTLDDKYHLYWIKGRKEIHFSLAGSGGKNHAVVFSISTK